MSSVTPSGIEYEVVIHFGKSHVGSEQQSPRSENSMQHLT